MNLYECLGVSHHRDASVSGEEWVQSPDGFSAGTLRTSGSRLGRRTGSEGIIRSHY